MNISDPAFRPAAPLALPENEVQVWRLELDALAVGEGRLWRLLSADEQARAGRFLVARVRQHFVAARAMLRTILAGYLATDPGKLTFRYLHRGKPSLASACAEGGIEFNLAHSGGVALLAVCRGHEIGVDVEPLSRDVEVVAIARRFFSAHEQAQLAEVAPEHKPEAFFRCWTRKEAFIKAKGEGLWLPLHQFDVSIAAGSQNALLATRPDSSEAARWSLREVDAGAGYVGALCIAGNNFRVRNWNSTES